MLSEKRESQREEVKARVQWNLLSSVKRLQLTEPPPLCFPPGRFVIFAPQNAEEQNLVSPWHMSPFLLPDG